MSNRFLLFSIAFLMSLLTLAGALAIPLFATELGASALELGIIGSAAAVTYTLMVVSAGSLSDRLGRKKVLIAGTLFTGSIYLLMPLSRTPMHMTIFMALCGIGLASFWPALEAWMSEAGDAEEIRRGLGGFNVSWSVGGALGPLIGGIIYTLSTDLTFVFVAAGTLVVAWLAYLHKPLRLDELADPAHDAVVAPRSKAEPISQSLLYSAWIANFAGWFAMAEIRVLFPKLGITLGMQPWVIGAITFVLGTALTVVFYIMGASGRWHGKAAPLLCAQGLVVVLLLLLARAESAIAFGVIFAGIGIGLGVSYSYSLYCSIVGSMQKGAASGRHEMVLGTGALLGPFLGGAAAEIFKTQRAPYVLSAGLLLAALVAGICLSLSSKRNV